MSLTNTMIITLVCSFFVTWIGLPVIYLWSSNIRSLFPEKKKTDIRITKKRNWVSFFILRPVLSYPFHSLLARINNLYSSQA